MAGPMNCRLHRPRDPAHAFPAVGAQRPLVPAHALHCTTRRASGARTGVVTLIQRHGSAANLNVHLHMQVLDGVVEPIGEPVRFRPAAAPREAQLQALLTRLVTRILRRLTKDGWLNQDTEPPSLDIEPRDVIAELAAASIRDRISEGPSAGQRILTLRSPALARPATPKPLTTDTTAADRRGPPSDVTEPAVIRKIMLHVQSRAAA